VATDIAEYAYGVAGGEVTRHSVRLRTHATGTGPLRPTVKHGDRAVTGPAASCEWWSRGTLDRASAAAEIGHTATLMAGR
jgi:hypothetical protein